MFRLLDRYLLGQFLVALGVFALAFIGLYVVVDVFAHIEDFSHLKQIPVGPFMLEYYGLRLPLFVSQLLPVIAVFAAMFTILRLRRNNEFLPMVSAGISLRRVFLPFFLMGGLAGVASLALDEWVLPELGDRLTETQTTLDRGEQGYFLLATDRMGRVFFTERYDNTLHEMNNLMVTSFGPDGAQIEKIFARKGRWTGEERGGWRLEDGKIYAYTEEGRLIPENTGPFVSSRIHDTDLKPQDLLKAGSLELHQTFAELAALARLHPQIPVFPMRIQSRLATFPVAVVLLLLTIPVVMSRNHQGLFVGLGICLAACAAYFIVQLLLVDLGNRAQLPPVAAAWLPVAGFGGAGALLLARMRT